MQYHDEHNLSRTVSHHTPPEDYAQVHSNVLDSGTVTVGLTTISNKGGGKVESTTLYLTPELARELIEQLSNNLKARLS